MERMHYIGADVHCAGSDLAVVTRSGRVTLRARCATTIAELAARVELAPRPRELIIEEGPLADWIYRGLAALGETVVVCEPRRNALIAKAGDKDDPIDAEKLAQLARGGYLQPVHHPESFERMVFKRLVWLYHDRVRNRVRQANRTMAQCRQYGVFIQEKEFAEAERRQELFRRLPSNTIVRGNIEVLLLGYDAAALQERQLAKQLEKQARKEEVIRRFVEVPGIRWIRAATFFAGVDTPWRFKTKQALWKYIGVGLERRRSGGPAAATQLHVANNASRILKNMILGAAKSAVASKQDRTFADMHARWLGDGLSPRNASRNVARSLAAALWGMWKSGAAYRPELGGASAASPGATASV